jgi:4-hydroxybenzoate polyprenyltransferase
MLPVTLVLLSLLILTSSVRAFHSHLQRPWEKPRSITRGYRQRNGHPVTVMFYTDPDRTQPKSDTHGSLPEGHPDKHTEELASSLLRTLRFTNDSTMTAPTFVNGAPTLPKGPTEDPMPPTPDNPVEGRVLDYTKELITMARPENLPGVVLFHMMGSCLAFRHLEAVAATTAASTSYLELLMSPSMMITLAALLLVSSTSMLVNDYYDWKLGNDSLKPDKPLQRVPLPVVKRALSHLYAVSLFCAALVPGVPGRVAVISGLILTFLYTKYIKPKTWAKNALCASLIALSPLTSGVAAMSVLSSTTSNLLFEYINWPLVRLVTLLFVGIMGREISMDINDAEDDSAHAVHTVPVVYGRPYASHVAWISSMIVAALAVSGPILESVDPSVTIRRAALAGMGSLLQMRRYWRVAETEGQDSHAIDVAVDEGLLSMVLLLASFI